MRSARTAPRLRDRFPILADSVYLDSHSMGAAPAGARAALDWYWDSWSRDGLEAWPAWAGRIEEIATGLAAILGAPAGTVWLAPNVSLLQAAIATCFDFRGERSGVVFEATMFPSLTYVWTAWERFGARITRVPSDDGRTLSTDRICSAITPQAAVVVLSHAAYVSGALIDAAAIAARCKETGAIFVLDAYQTTGVYPYAVSSLGVDVLVGGSHKWLCGGPGCGFIYVDPAIARRFEPALTGWWAHRSPFAFAPAPIDYADSMSRWNSGSPPIPGYLAAQAGHDAIREVGVAAIREHNVRLTTILAEKALERGFTVPTPLDPARRTGWIGMDFPGAGRVQQELAKRRVFCDYREGCGLRVGPHFYTDEAEIDAFFAALDALR
jgi:kynureninase